MAVIKCAIISSMVHRSTHGSTVHGSPDVILFEMCLGHLNVASLRLWNILPAALHLMVDLFTVQVIVKYNMQNNYARKCLVEDRDCST